MNDPVEVVEMRAAITRARGVFLASVEAAVVELIDLAGPFAEAIGEIAPSEALEAWREAAIAALAQQYRRNN